MGAHRRLVLAQDGTEEWIVQRLDLEWVQTLVGKVEQAHERYEKDCP